MKFIYIFTSLVISSSFVLSATLDSIESSLEKLKQHDVLAIQYIDKRNALKKEIETLKQEAIKAGTFHEIMRYERGNPNNSEYAKLTEAYSDMATNYSSRTRTYLVEIQHNIDRYIPRLNHNVGIIGEYPKMTEEFLQKTKEVAEVIEPYIPNLLSASYSEINKQDINNAFQILDYAKPSEFLKQGILNHVNTPRKYPKNTNVFAYQTLFNLDLQDGVIIDNLKNKILTDLTNNKDTDSTAILYKLSSSHIIPEFIPLFVEKLKQLPSRSNVESRLTGVYAVLRQLRDWGNEAALLLPYIKEQMQLLEMAYSDAGLTLNRRPYEDAVGIIGKDLRGLKIRTGYAYLVDAQKRGELDSNFNLITTDYQTFAPPQTTQPKQTTEQAENNNICSLKDGESKSISGNATVFATNVEFVIGRVSSKIEGTYDVSNDDIFDFTANTEGPPSRAKPRARGEKSKYDDKGGEWRPHKPDKYHPEGHWDHKPSGGAWQNIYN